MSKFCKLIKTVKYVCAMCAIEFKNEINRSNDDIRYVVRYKHQKFIHFTIDLLNSFLMRNIDNDQWMIYFEFQYRDDISRQCEEIIKQKMKFVSIYIV